MNIVKKHWKWVTASLTVGIVGSALWENLMRDLFSFIGKILLTISTLGIEKYKNNLYANIAQGFYEQVSIKILSLALGIFIGFCLASLIMFWKMNRQDIKNSKIINWLAGHSNFARNFFLIYTVVAMCMITLTLTQTVYINKSIAHYNQLIKIAAPSLSSDEEEMFNSRFAQIKNKEDYIQIMNELTRIINDMGKNIPGGPSFVF